MSLAHALIISLLEKPNSGIELTRRFSRSIGFFWSATHQQIYRELGQMAEKGWIETLEAEKSADQRQKIYVVTDQGKAELARWLQTPHRPPELRDPVTVKLRAAAAMPDVDLANELRDHLARHQHKLKEYLAILVRDFPDHQPLSRQQKLQRLILNKGIAYEKWETEWAEQALELLQEA